MINWSLIPEYIALLLILVIMLFFYDKNRIRTFRRTLYWTCLCLSAANIVVNINCVHTIENATRIPIWANTLLNTFYFWLSVLMCTCAAFYLFRRILEFVYEKHCLQRAIIGLSAIMVFYTGLCLWNLFSGVLFYFDKDGIIFSYNPYQVAPYSQGVVELKPEYWELQGIINSEYLPYR